MQTLYEQQIVEKLVRYEREGLGRLIELCDVEISGKKITAVGFQTGERVRAVVTARHHIPEAFATDSSVLKMIEAGIQDTVFIPVVDVSGYDAAQTRINGWEKETDKGAFFLYDALMHANSRFHGSFPIMKWEYGLQDASELTIKIQEYVKKANLVIDLHNAKAKKYFAITDPISFDDLPNGAEQVLWEKMIKEIGRKFMGVMTDVVNSSYVEIHPGIFRFACPLAGNICTYSKNQGVFNLAIHVPCFNYEGEHVYFKDVRHLERTNVEIASKLIGIARYIRTELR